MNTLKETGLYLVKSFFGVSLLILPSAFLFTFVFSQPAEIKKIAKEEGVYASISRAVSGAVVGSLESSQQVSSLPKSVVATASEKAFSPRDIQAKGDKLIDDGYGWLNGEKASFSPQVDIESNKKVLAESLAQEMSETLVSKPVCTYEQLSTLRVDNLAAISSAPCQPQGFDVSSLTILFMEDITGLQSNNAALTQVPLLASTQPTPRSNEKSVLSDVSIPKIFQVLKSGFYIVLLVVFLCIGSMYLLLKDIPKWRRMIAKPLLVSGVLLVAYALIVQWLLRQNLLSKLTMGAEGGTAQSIIRPFADIGIQVNLIFGIGFIVCAVVLFVIHRQLKPKKIVADAKREFIPSPNVPLDYRYSQSQYAARSVDNEASSLSEK